MQRKRRSNDIHLSKSASEIGSERQMSGDGDDSVSRSIKRKRGAEDRSQSEGASRICSVRQMRGDGADDSVSRSNKRKRVLKDRNQSGDNVCDRGKRRGSSKDSQSEKQHGGHSGVSCQSEGGSVHLGVVMPPVVKMRGRPKGCKLTVVGLPIKITDPNLSLTCIHQQNKKLFLVGWLMIM